MLIISTLTILSSCEEKEELTKANILDYVFFELVYGEVTYTKKDSSVMPYELQCTATLKIKPKGEYIFENTSCTCTLVQSSDILSLYGWNVAEKGMNEGALIGSEKGWKGVINLDKDGYGEISIRIRRSSTETSGYPKESNFVRSIVKVTGTVIIK